jgi:hypothetical protein
MDVTQRNATRNQSTADYESKRIFIFDNRFVEGVFKNTTVGSYSLKHGELVARSLTDANGFIPVTADNIADVIGIAKIDGGPVVLAASATANINIGTKGTIDGNLLVLPAGITLNSVPVDGTKTLRDILEGIGFHVDTSTVDNTKFDN